MAELVGDMMASVTAAATEEERVAALTQMALLPRAQEQILAADGAPLLAGLLAETNSMACREVVVALIRNLAIAPAAHAPLLEAGVLPGLVDALTDGSAECRGYAQDALLSLLLERGTTQVRGWAGTTRTRPYVRVRANLATVPGVGGPSTVYRALMALMDHGSAMLRRTFRASLRQFHEGGSLDVSRLLVPISEDTVAPGEECPICLARLRGVGHASAGGAASQGVAGTGQEGQAYVPPSPVDATAGGGTDKAESQPYGASSCAKSLAQPRGVHHGCCGAKRCGAGTGGAVEASGESGCKVGGRILDGGHGGLPGNVGSNLAVAGGVTSGMTSEAAEPGGDAGARASDDPGEANGGVAGGGGLGGVDGATQDPLQIIALHPCRHRMHRGCAEMWLAVSPCCPMCRKLLVE
eukprot:jgi/Mesvir1/29474/Mv23045-RA.1